MKKGIGKTALLSLILLSLEAVSILIGVYRVVGTRYLDWKADKIKEEKVEAGQFVTQEHTLIVPDLTGRNFYEVSSEYEELGGWLRKGGYDYSDEYPEDTIISQDVQPGKEILYGSILYVTLSVGPKPDFIRNDENKNNEVSGEESVTAKLIEVPDLKGLTQEEATIRLYQKGINVGEVLYGYSIYSDTLLNKVMDQSIMAGEYLHAGESIDLVICVGGLDDHSDQNQGQNNDKLDDTQLCQLASDYYYNHNGVRPPGVRIDSYDGDIVVIHLYEALTDHDATWDWYYVDRNTGETTNFMGESFNIFTD